MPKIITEINILKTHNENVSLKEGQEIIQQLESALSSSTSPGLGLAAPQIAINKTVCIVRAKHKDGQAENLDLINPVIISKEKSFINKNEGCLSLPGVAVDTRRYSEIFVKDDLHPDGFVAIGSVAIIIQHEVDHLESILIVDRAAGKNKIKPNEPCPCGKKLNGKPIKFKKCHGRRQ